MTEPPPWHGFVDFKMGKLFLKKKMIWMAFTAISKKFPLHLSEYWPNIVHSYRLRNIFYFCIFFRFKTLLAPFTYLLSNFSLKTDVISINHSQVKLKHSLFSVILPFTYGGIYGLYQANFFQDRGLVQIKSLWNAAPWNSFSHFSHVKHSMKVAFFVLLINIPSIFVW